MRSDLRITFPHITFPQEVDNLARSLCAAARAAAAVPGAVRRGGTARPCPRGRLGAPGAVPVLRGRRAADRLSCRQGALAPSRAPAAPRFRSAAGRSRARRARSDRRLPGRRGGMRLAAARGTAVRLGRRREALFCSCASPGFCIALAGVTLFGSAKTGALLYGIQVVSALLTGIFVSRGTENGQTIPVSPEPSDSRPFSVVFCSAVRHAAAVSLDVTAFLVTFSAVLTLMEPVFSRAPRCGCCPACSS